MGKSTIGVILAKVLGYQFVDADLLIQQSEHKLLKDIIAEKGVEGFIEVENRVNANLHTNNSVIATGGSVIYGKEAMKHLGEIGTIIYLKQTLPSIRRRLNNIQGRGVVLKEGQTFSDLYRERCALYEKYADITVDQHGLSIEQTMHAVCAALEGFNS